MSDKSFHKRFNIDTDFICIGDDAYIIDQAFGAISTGNCLDVVVSREGSNFTKLKGKHAVMSLGEKITILEDNTFIYGWV